MASAKNWWKDCESKRIGVVRVSDTALENGFTIGHKSTVFFDVIFLDATILGVKREPGVAQTIFMLESKDFEIAEDKTYVPEYTRVITVGDGEIESMVWSKTDEGSISEGIVDLDSKGGN